MGKSTAQASPRRAAGRSVRLRILLQLGAIVGLSAVLGLTFNSSNPVGIRWTTFSEPGEEVPAPAAQPAMSSTAAAHPRDVEKTDLVEPQLSVPVDLTPIAPAGSSELSNTPPPATNPVSVTWAEVKQLMSPPKVVLVDVRPKPFYDAGHITGAISLPETSTPEEFAAFRERFPADTMLVVYCSSISCSQSLRVASRLVQEFGYTSVRYMTGGYMEWQREELAQIAPNPQPPQP